MSDDEWRRHHVVVVAVLVALTILVPVYAALRGYSVWHDLGHVVPLMALTLLAYSPHAGRATRQGAAALGLMTASALVVHVSHGATEAHFMFFALLPLAAVYAARTPFLLAVAFVAGHHFLLGSLQPGSVFEPGEGGLSLAALHAGFVLVESVACLLAWRLFEDRRELVARLVLDRTQELRGQHATLSRLAAVVASTDDAVITTTADGVIDTWNAGAERLYGFTREEAVGSPISLVMSPGGRAAIESELAATGASSNVHVERLDIRKDGSRFSASVTVSRIVGEHGEVTGFVEIARDVSERKRAEAAARDAAQTLEAQAEQLTRLAMHDPLTGLANRTLMHDRLARALAARGSQCAILLLDLDDFKSINDVHGHAVGDEVLVEVARRLRQGMRRGDTVARLGGDEFVVLLEDVDDVDQAVSTASRLLMALEQPIHVADAAFTVVASVGVSVSDLGVPGAATELIRDADIAMYAAKAAGKNRVELFQVPMRDKVVAQSEIVRDLREAVAREELRLVYQPQVDLATGRVTGVEALVRWQHPVRGLIPPDMFIPDAERTGIIMAIDDWVLRRACEQIRDWDRAGLPSLNVAVNVSAGRLVTGDLASTVGDVTRALGVAADRLEVEITETVAVHAEAEAAAVIRAVRALGTRVSIDDFGMGHSSLSRLRAFPLDRLKIDRSFIAHLTADNAHGSIPDAMIAVARSLGLDVVAEGVETQEHVRALRLLGCSSAQGYLLSRPLPAADVERLLRADAPLLCPATTDLEREGRRHDGRRAVPALPRQTRVAPAADATRDLTRGDLVPVP